MKKTSILIVLVFVYAFVHAQVTKSTNTDAAFGVAFNKVVLDFPSNFSAIQGSHMPVEVDADTYVSTVCLPGALACKIMRYHSVEDKTASWQAVLYSGESFDEAVKLYKKVYGLVKKSSLRGIDASASSFDGKYENVDESVGFAVSSLRLKTTNKRYRDLVAEIEITGNYTGWEVHLNVYAKKQVAEPEEPK